MVTRSKNALAIPMERGELIANGIPGATFMPLHSANHLLVKRAPAFPGLIASTMHFLARMRRQTPLPRLMEH